MDRTVTVTTPRCATCEHTGRPAWRSPTARRTRDYRFRLSGPISVAIAMATEGRLALPRKRLVSHDRVRHGGGADLRDSFATNWIRRTPASVFPRAS
jgi:hypothetical protein